MPQAELTACVPSQESLSVIVSRITRSQTLSSIARALAEPAVSELLPFETCSLLLPNGERDEHAPRWRALRSVPGSEQIGESFFRRAPALMALASACEEASPSILDEEELVESPELTDEGARSALLFPLSSVEGVFGALCFATSTREAYRLDDALNLRWLADLVSFAAGSCLSRERLESGREAARELERLRGGFVKTLVEDVRLPLTSVLGLLELFESKVQAREPFDMEDRQLLKGAIEQGDRMRRLMDDLLEISRQHEHPLALKAERVETAVLLAEAIEPLRGEAALRGVELNVQVGAGTSALEVDVRQAHRALRHLLGVALASTPDGGRIGVQAQSITGTRLGDEGQRFVIFNVSDSGAGLAPEEIPFVFDAFWHASGAGRRVGSAGRGLGLAIAKRIAAAHGGNVSVRSQLGTGTTYSILLPAAAARHRTDTQAQHILVVDDAPELLLLLGKLIERMSYRVTTAPNVARALEVLRENKVDLLITDWAMPEASGGDLICALRSDERLAHIPVIVLTGHDTDVERCEAERAGCDRFLVKPVMRDELQSAISELLPRPAQTTH
ncbi:MAG TPA: hybrid sensor histidine kinase/response regulator [Pyrinomonadaceae bacterium]|jgi:signal transduction histidine kinase/ActR/RegA family two-component response regulator